MNKIKEMKDWTNERLNIALAKASGQVERQANAVFYGLIPRFSEDVETAHKLQANALQYDAEGYVRHLSLALWTEAVDPEEVDDWASIEIRAVAELLAASPRHIAEAAYLTLFGMEKKRNGL